MRDIPSPLGVVVYRSSRLRRRVRGFHGGLASPPVRFDTSLSICSLTSGGGPWMYRTAPQDIKMVGVSAGSSHFDPQRSVVLQKERSGYGFRPALDQLGGFILIEVGAGHVSDEDPVSQPLREYRCTRRRCPFLFQSSTSLASGDQTPKGGAWGATRRGFPTLTEYPCPCPPWSRPLRRVPREVRPPRHRS